MDDRSGFLARVVEATDSHDLERIVGCFTRRDATPRGARGAP